MQTRTALYTVVALIIVAAGAYALFQYSGGTPKSLNADLYPLYAGASWGQVQAATSTSAVGYEVVSNPITNVTDVASTTEPFETYYEQKLAKAGWTQAPVPQAKSPGALVYTKGSQFIVVSYTTGFETQLTGASDHCPCAVQLSLISGAGK